MSKPRFFTDEDIYGAAAIALRRAGFDAVSTPETGRMRTSDESQLVWAVGEGRTLVTFNVAHFASLHSVWLGTGKSHAGIVVSSQRPIGDLMRRLVRLANALDADSMCDRIEYLSDW
ncbi:MAG: DUF5615 family PIN-like protein [Pirellulales bacterium]